MNKTEELKDIKPLLEIPDISYYLYVGFLTLVSVVVLGVIFFLVRRFWLNRKKDIRKVYFKQLKEVNWDNPKKASYAVTNLGRVLCKDKRSEEIYRQLLPLLQRYKYKKEVPTVDSETLKQYNLLVHIIDESI